MLAPDNTRDWFSVSEHLSLLCYDSQGTQGNTEMSHLCVNTFNEAVCVIILSLHIPNYEVNTQ